MIERRDLLPMIAHWLSTPVNGYFGSDYGANLNALLLRPLSAPIADEFIAKLRRDIPILGELSADQLSIMAENEGFERKRIYLRLLDVTIDLSKVAAQVNGVGIDANSG